ncbi:GAF domain-containing protein [Desulfonema magnum]|uniref:GAF domain-containing protein n=1 Tax=Desulfonema magnum TaxID=45655 RepID=A0A975GQR6_9BACT|nr:GAF domain-containing protein [Desulfonema magnum]QTA90179.1 GAF domain-containing protein [Desulfonema magnum]
MNEKPVRRIHLQEFKAISRAIITYEDLNMLLNHTVEGVCRAFQVKGCSIMLFDDREKEFFRVSSHGISDEYLGKGPLPVDKKYCSFVTGEPIFIEDMQNDPRVKYPEAADKEGLVSMLSVPIKCRERIIGIIRIYNNESWTLDEDDVDSFCLLAEQLGCVIENNGLKNFLDQVKISLGSLPLRMLEGL